MPRFLAFASLSVCYLVLLMAETMPAQTVNDEGLWMAFLAQGTVGDQDAKGPAACTDLTCTNLGCCDQGCCCDQGRDSQLLWWFDGHARFLDDAGGFNQSIVRPGLGWSLNDRSAVWAGYGWIRTSPLAGADFDEHRIWQQWTWSESLGSVTVAARSRLEQRFIETGDDLGWRFRQLLRAQHALPNCPRLTLVGWNEIFFHLNDTDWGAESGFNQNRAFIGFGLTRKRQSRWRTEIGYLHQAINVPVGADRSNHILSINIYRNP